MKSKPKTLRTEVDGVPLLLEESHALPLISVTVALRSGAVFDPPDSDGATRLASRLSRRTAGGRPMQAIEEELDRLGASLGSDVGYAAASLSGVTIARSLEPFIDLVADATGRPSLDAAEFERLKRETCAEITEGLDNDRSLAHRAMRRALFPNHAYSRTTTGTLASIERLTHDVVVSQARALQKRDNLVIGLSGDLDLETATRLAERIVTALPSGPVPGLALTDPDIPPGRRLIIVDKPERAQAQILMGLLGSHPSDTDHSALQVAMTVFGGTFSSRLMQEIRVARGWSYGAYATLPVDQRRQALTVWTFPSKDDAAACTKLMLDMLSALVEGGITPKELSFAKKSLIRSHAFSTDTAAKRLGLSLDSELLALPSTYYDQYEQRISAVTLEQTAQALKKRVDPSRLVVAVVGSAADLKQPLSDAISDLAAVDIVPFDSPDL